MVSRFFVCSSKPKARPPLYHIPQARPVVGHADTAHGPRPTRPTMPRDARCRCRRCGPLLAAHCPPLGTRLELCIWGGGSPPDLVWVAQATSATPSTLNQTGRDTAETKVKTERIPIMEEMMCAMALKSTYGRQTHHTKAGLPVCCEQALKSVGKRNTHGAYRALRGPSGTRPRERSNTSGWHEARGSAA
jgi:hypothetical protein